MADPQRSGNQFISPGLASVGVMLIVGAFAAPKQATSTPSVTYHGHIEKLLVPRCSPCHNSAGNGPFALETYEDFAKNAELVRIQLMIKGMPPLRGTSPHTAFTPITPLTDDELVTVQQWMAAGLPKGGPQLAPQKLNLSTMLTAPSYVLKPKSMPASIVEEGAQYWRAYVLEFPKSGAYLSSFDFLPETPKAVRSVTLFSVPASSLTGVEPEFPTAGSLHLTNHRLIGRWVPGYPHFQLPEGYAIQIHPGHKLIAQVQYQPIGRPASAGFAVRVKSNAQKPKRLVTPKLVELSSFRIRARENPSISLKLELNAGEEVLGVTPIARFFASQIEVILFDRTQKKSVLSVDRWDPYLIGNYMYRAPIKAQKGDSLHATFSYSNDENCVMNEEQEPKDVFSGPRIEDEICRLYLLTAR